MQTLFNPLPLMTTSQSQAQELFQATRADFLKQCREYAYLVAMRRANKQCTVDDIREAISIPNGWDGRLMGAVFTTGKKGEWEAVGFVKSRQKINHGRPITIFQLKPGKTANNAAQN